MRNWFEYFTNCLWSDHVEKRHLTWLNLKSKQGVARTCLVCGYMEYWHPGLILQRWKGEL